jgi:UDP-N-acetylmuramoylalanine--D-glutamate ligase
VLILGGSTKGVSFDSLAEAVAQRPPRAILLVGAEAPRIAAALDRSGVGYEHAPGPMADVVRRSAKLAEPGDVVLLSPACASFGDFRNYADRGDQFTQAVLALR